MGAKEYSCSIAVWLEQQAESKTTFFEGCA